MNVSDLRQVALHFNNEVTPTTYLIPAVDVDKFVAATKKLHCELKVNPFNGASVREVDMITVAKIEEAGPYWWSTPNLDSNGNTEGAKLYMPCDLEVVYRGMIK